jgi:hypothetical protein
MKTLMNALVSPIFHSVYYRLVYSDGLEFDFRWRKEIFLFSTASRPALENTHAPIRWLPEAHFAVREAAETLNSLSSSVEVKNGGAITSLLHTSSWRESYWLSTGISLHFLQTHIWAFYIVSTSIIEQSNLYRYIGTFLGSFIVLL